MSVAVSEQRPVKPEETASPDGAPHEVRPSSPPDQVQRWTTDHPVIRRHSCEREF